MVVLLSLLAALAFAFGNVLQQKGTLDVPAEANDPRFLAQILERPVWLVGGALQGAGWILQAAALDRGSLVVVQSLTTTSLVMALPLGVRFTNQQVSRRVVVGAIVMVLGITGFLLVGSPHGGTSNPSAQAWWTTGILATALVALLTAGALRRTGAMRALFFGSAAGICFALQASVTKVFVGLIGDGAHAILSSWTIYALIVSALVGFGLQQSALKSGVLAPAMASSNAVTMVASILIGVTTFGEALSSGDNRLAPALIGLAAALVGVVLLAGQEAPTNPGQPPPRLLREDTSREMGVTDG